MAEAILTVDSLPASIPSGGIFRTPIRIDGIKPHSANVKPHKIPVGQAATIYAVLSILR